MATITPEIISLNPSNQVIIHVPTGQTFGSSNLLTLSVRLKFNTVNRINVHMLVRIIDPALYRFDNNLSVMEYFHHDIANNSILSPEFRIKNIAPLVGMPLRLRVITNDINFPDYDMWDSHLWPVSATNH